MASDATATSGSSQRTRLPKWIEKQLALDIEEAGGLRFFDKGKTQGLADLLDYRSVTLEQPEFYGLRGSEERRKVRNKVDKWKGWSEQKYLKKLAELGVKPASIRKQNPSKPRTPKTPKGGQRPSLSSRVVDTPIQEVEKEFSSPESLSQPPSEKRKVQKTPASNTPSGQSSTEAPLKEITTRSYIAPKQVKTMVQHGKFSYLW